MPVAVTTIDPVPRVTDVFWNSMFDRSPSATSAPGSVAASLPIGALSPVSAASCVSSVADRTIRPSAGTMSPASTSTTSPGTTSTAGTMATEPSRTTLACGTCRFASAVTLARAFNSWRDPSTTFNSTSSATMMPVETSPIAKLTTVTATSMMFIGSRSCPSATAQTDGGFSLVISFGPYCDSRLAASAALNPDVASVPNDPATSETSRAYGGACASPEARSASSWSVSMIRCPLCVTVPVTATVVATPGSDHFLYKGRLFGGMGRQEHCGDKTDEPECREHDHRSRV